VSVLEENYIVDYTEAKNEPAKQPNFITKKLNIWADSAKTWIDANKWASLGNDINLSQFTGFKAYLGIDLGSTGDFSALSILIPNEDKTKIYLFMKFYIPEEMANKRTKADMINFKQWANDGWIKLTPGDATDYNFIKADILNLKQILDIKQINYDSALAKYFAEDLESGLTGRDLGDPDATCKPFGQNIGNVTAPTKQFYEWIIDKTIEHDNNPVMAWMVSNIEVYQDDANGNYKIHKGKSKNKVDGPCAVVNAIGALMPYYFQPATNNYVWDVN
jgi:phage terminase large subunit-like protein